jgi:hypothetical protein
MIPSADPQGRPSRLAGLPGKASALCESARAAAAELVEGFRRSDRFFKMRVGIVGAWAVVSLATLWGTCGPLESRNSLGADVQVNRDSIMGVQLLVRNESSQIWDGVTLTLDDGWKYSQQTMRPQDLVVLPMSHFRKGDESPPADHEPRSLKIECGRGSGRFDLR